MLDGLTRLPLLTAKLQSLNQTAVAITDHGAMYGALHFYNACRKADIKPIIGLEAYMAKNSRLDKQLKMGSDQFHITLLAQNHEGYKNLLQLTTIANLEGFSYKPRIDKELLEKYNANLIVTSGCMSSLINRYLLDGKEDAAKKEIAWFKEVFKDRFYIEIQAHPSIAVLADLTKTQIRLAREFDLPLVATNDVHYVEQADAEAQDALICVQTRKLVSDTKRMTMLDSPDFYVRSTQEMETLFKDYPEAITNTQVITEQCNVIIPQGKLIFPAFPLPAGETEASYFSKLAEAGLKKRFKNVTPEHTNRLNYEMDIINQKGYAAYFLITQDFVNWAKNQGIGVGPGRGSAAGSLVAYSLNITAIDPFLHGLPFERFLNPQRPTPPDIDMDFADNRRDEVIAYVAKKYGADHVAQVITFGRMEARVSIRDIGRVLGMPYEDPDRIAKLIPNDPGHKTSLDQAVEQVPELKEYYKQPKYKKLIDLAKKVEGVVRHSSVHAAAVIIADKPLPEYTALQQDSKSGKMVTQYDMYALDSNISDDAIGLLKFDFLGLRNLSIIQTALELIKKYKKIDVDINNLPLDDRPTFDLLASGDTFGVFQLESAGMRRVARTLKPNQFSDITAMVALYRPGPMDLIPQFIEGKHNPDKVVYLHPSLKPVLAETYGIMVYQEQILQIAHVMAGYSLGEADILRRAIGKKKKELLDENKKRFILQSIEKGYPKETADQVWGFIEAFANYGFNKAHAASYAMIAYETAYLKAHYPVEYMTALMSIEAGSVSVSRDEKIAQGIEECKKMGIIIKAPDINASFESFTLELEAASLEGLAVRFGLNAIKNVGAAAIASIVETRDRVKKFNSFTHFLIESDSRKVNKKVLESLIKVGAFDAFGTRASMIEQLEDIRGKATQFHSEVEGQDTLFGGVAENQNLIQDTFAKLPEYPKAELLSFEKELLGLYLTEHPLARALEHVHDRATKQIKEIDASIHQGQTFMFGGVITKLREVTTKKNGSLMAFGTIEDQTGRVDFLIFPKLYATLKDTVKADQVVLLKGKIDYKDEELALIADKIIIPEESLLADIPESRKHEIFIPRKTAKESLQELGKLLKANPGDDQAIIMIPNGATPRKMVLPYTIQWSDELKTKIAKLLE